MNLLAHTQATILIIHSFIKNKRFYPQKMEKLTMKLRYKCWAAVDPPWSMQHAHKFFPSGGTCTLLPSFLGVHPNFWGSNVPSNSSFGGTKKINCIFSTCDVILTILWRFLPFLFNFKEVLKHMYLISNCAI
jgi:hypothetical protein